MPTNDATAVRGSEAVRSYTIVLMYDPEMRLYSVDVPALPGCTSAGATVEECLSNAREAIRGHIATLEEMGLPVPEETEGATVIVATVAA